MGICRINRGSLKVFLWGDMHDVILLQKDEGQDQELWAQPQRNRVRFWWKRRDVETGSNRPDVPEPTKDGRRSSKSASLHGKRHLNQI
jgi:hypothetical protein